MEGGLDLPRGLELYLELYLVWPQATPEWSFHPPELPSEEPTAACLWEQGRFLSPLELSPCCGHKLFVRDHQARH